LSIKVCFMLIKGSKDCYLAGKSQICHQLLKTQYPKDLLQRPAFQPTTPDLEKGMPSFKSYHCPHREPIRCDFIPGRAKGITSDLLRLAVCRKSSSISLGRTSHLGFDCNHSLLYGGDWVSEHQRFLLAVYSKLRKSFESRCSP